MPRVWSEKNTPSWSGKCLMWFSKALCLSENKHFQEWSKCFFSNSDSAKSWTCRDFTNHPVIHLPCWEQMIMQTTNVLWVWPSLRTKKRRETSTWLQGVISNGSGFSHLLKSSCVICQNLPWLLYHHMIIFLWKALMMIVLSLSLSDFFQQEVNTLSTFSGVMSDSFSAHCFRPNLPGPLTDP